MNPPTKPLLRPLGNTGLNCHPLGFGCYRVADGNAEHEAALREYMERGGNLIDTSANYTDGQSELLVGKVIKNYARQAVIVVTKAGYIQGQNMALASRRPFPEVVKYGEGLWHCIHPEFLETQLTLSMQRLQQEPIDVFLLHNPEYFLNHQARRHRLDESDHQEFYRRIGQAFGFLEEQVSQGKIRWYGISSNNFGLPLSDPVMTSVHRCLEQARAISANHHFCVIQLPMNLYESGGALEPNNEGMTVLDYCRSQGLGVLINRPLNAFHQNRMIRLVDFMQPGKEPPGKEHLDRILESLRAAEGVLSRDLGAANSGLADLLAQIVPQVRSVEHWDPIVDRYVIPPIQQWIRKNNESYRDDPAWDRGLQEFLRRVYSSFEGIERYLQAQQQSTSDEVREKLTKAGYPISPVSLSQMAIGMLLSLDGISCVLNGMRRCSYLHDSLGAVPLPAVDALSILRQFLRS